MINEDLRRMAKLAGVVLTEAAIDSKDVKKEIEKKFKTNSGETLLQNRKLDSLNVAKIESDVDDEESDKIR